MVNQPQNRRLTRGSSEARHAAMVAAEMRRVERRLRAVGPMPRQALARACGEVSWREGTLSEAVREGIRQHRLKRLPLGWLAAERER